MAERYQQRSNLTGETHFTQSPVLDVEHSSMVATSRHITTFNGGDIVPIYYKEILPGEEHSLSVDEVIRLTTMIRPVFGELICDIYAFFVPNRVVNESFVNVMGENSAGAGISPDVTLAPLVVTTSGLTQVPVGSVADYYGFPTQAPLPNSLLSQMNDLKFRGYLAIYNEFFRDQNYQPPIAFTKLNMFEGFFNSVGTSLPSVSVSTATSSTGDFGASAFQKAYGGEGSTSENSTTLPVRRTTWSALSKPLKANKLHDYFTSVLPFPQKGLSLSIMFPSDAQVLPLTTSSGITSFSSGQPLRFGTPSPLTSGGNNLGLVGMVGSSSGYVGYLPDSSVTAGTVEINGSNLVVNFDAGSLGTLDIAQLRTVIATQQVFEVLARAGSRYREVTQALFGIQADDPYRDIPSLLGHVRRTLNNYQVAQTSQSSEGGSPQANLAAYSYTATGGFLYDQTFLEHGYVHVLCVVRQKNLYSTLLWQDNFRRSMLDFYLPPLANISEQPVKLSRISPFRLGGDSNVFGYQEAWAEYRYEPDRVSGLFRSGLKGALTSWLYLDEFNDEQGAADASFMTSNAEAAINPTLAIESSEQPQFFAEFTFKSDKTLPMPTYSVPGLDIF